MSTIAILGRQPAIGLAELESLFTSKHVTPVGNMAALIDLPLAPSALDRLGGTTRLAKPIKTLGTVDFGAIGDYLRSTVVEYSSYLPSGKLTVGLSFIGFNTHPKAIGRLGLELKKIIKANGRSVRLVPNSNSELSSAQVIHNKLIGPNAWELLFIRDGSKTILAQTTAVQNIEAYAARDQARPKRDARVGMLPPKLAQIIINLARGPISKSLVDSRQSSAIASKPVVLDPFCGTGVVLQEALLMAYSAYGTDLEPRMIEYSRANLDWLNQEWKIEEKNWKIEVGDATKHTWQQPFSFVASETYLGTALSGMPSPEKLREIIGTCDRIHHSFLENLAKQTPKGFRACLAVPAWRVNGQFKHMSVLDHLEKLRYNRIKFSTVSNQDLVYARPDQLVARELVVLERI